MTPLGFHINFKARDRRVLCPDAATQRRAALGVLRACRPFELLTFRIADTHFHIELMGSLGEVTEALRRVRISLRRGLPVPFTEAWFEPILGQSHVDTAFRYVLRQEARHGFGHDPYAEASNLPDLLGLRLAGTWTATHVRRWLPRLGRPTLLSALRVEELDALPVPAEELAEATTAASGLVDLRGKRPELVAARCAAVHASSSSSREIAEVLRISMRSVQRHAEREADPRLVRAICLQADLRRRRPVDEAEFVHEPVAAYGDESRS